MLEQYGFLVLPGPRDQDRFAVLGSTVYDGFNVALDRSVRESSYALLRGRSIRFCG